MQKIIFVSSFILWCMALQAQNPTGILTDSSEPEVKFTNAGECSGSIEFDVNGDACGSCELRLFKDRDPAGDPNSPDEAQSVTNGSEATFSNLCAGTYSFVLYNADFDCYYYYEDSEVVETCDISITSVSKEDESCREDGSITINISDSHPPYIYDLIKDGEVVDRESSNELSYTFSGLAGGSYTIKASNSGCCEVEQTISIAEGSSDLSIDNVSTTPTRCDWTSDGTATLQVSGGDGSYFYSWSSLEGGSQSASGGSTFTISGLAQGSHDITVMSDGCSATTTVEIVAGQGGNCYPPDDSSECIITIGFATQRGCFSEEPVSPGASYVTVQESGNYFYEWEDGSTESFIIAYAEGTYCLTVTDADDPTCKATDCVYIGENPGCKGNKPNQNNNETENGQIINRLGEFRLNVIVKPNPFNNELLIELNSPNYQTTALEVVDINGKTIHQAELELSKGENTETLETAHWSSGIYQIIVRDGEGNAQVEKVVKMD
ncbi:MAG: T9SS type A sorting domain-containing protein [Bacteroidota bacterium]